jgi:hypothetical protein
MKYIVTDGQLSNLISKVQIIANEIFSKKDLVCRVEMKYIDDEYYSKLYPGLLFEVLIYLSYEDMKEYTYSGIGAMKRKIKSDMDDFLEQYFSFERIDYLIKFYETTC